MDWFEREFKENLGKRYETMRKALDIFSENKGQLIIETGTTRMMNDWGAGYSTVVFGEYLRRNGGSLITVDLSPQNIEFCKSVTGLYASFTQYVTEDSHEFFRTFTGEIDLLYLDSYDYPYFELLDRYGGRDETTIQKVEGIGEDEIVARHSDLITPSQQHQLDELKLALPHVKKGTPILLDDCGLAGGGKGRLTKIYLKEIGATEIIDGYQSLWIL